MEEICLNQVYCVGRPRANDVLERFRWSKISPKRPLWFSVWLLCVARDDVKFERAYISKRSGGSKPESGRDGSGKHLQGNTIPIFLLFRYSLGYSTSV